MNNLIFIVTAIAVILVLGSISAVFIPVDAGNNNKITIKQSQKINNADVGGGGGSISQSQSACSSSSCIN